MGDKIFKTIIGDIEEKSVDERALTVVITTRTVDRDGEVIDPKGAELSNYEKNPVVLWAHDYKSPPIGRCLWLRQTKDNIKAKVQFAETQFADEIYRLYKDGYLRAWSIGFIPKEWEDGDGEKTPKRTYKKWELLEFSAVPVPANPEALTLAVQNGELALKSQALIKALNLEDAIPKRVIPYSVHGDSPKAPEDEKWDAAREVRDATVEDLKIMCAWYDAENPDVKSSYKLPHHKAGGGHPVVWNGVRAAMAALLGARGGVNIPSGDRKGVYNHLVKHYKQFDKEPPEFRDYTEEELKELFPELYEEKKDVPEDLEEILLNLKLGNIDIPEAVEEIKQWQLKQELSAAIGKLVDAVMEKIEAKQEPIGEDISKDETQIAIKIADNDNIVAISAEELADMIRASIRGEIGRLKGDVDYII